MRRTKIKDLSDIKDIVESITNLMPDDVIELKNNIRHLEDHVKRLHNMKHVDYMKSRKILLEISRKSMEMRQTILDTHKLFTEDPKNKNK